MIATNCTSADVLTLDTNVFIYALDSRDPSKQGAAVELLSEARALDCSIALQCCGEVYAALTRRLNRAPWEAAQAARNVMSAFRTFGMSRGAVERALAEAGAGRFSYRDGALLAAAHEAGCRFCLSEDMKDGARLGDVEIVAPFGPAGVSDRARAVLTQLKSAP